MHFGRTIINERPKGDIWQASVASNRNCRYTRIGASCLDGDNFKSQRVTRHARCNREWPNPFFVAAHVTFSMLKVTLIGNYINEEKKKRDEKNTKSIKSPKERTCYSSLVAPGMRRQKWQVSLCTPINWTSRKAQSIKLLQTKYTYVPDNDRMLVAQYISTSLRNWFEIHAKTRDTREMPKSTLSAQWRTVDRHFSLEINRARCRWTNRVTALRSVRLIRYIERQMYQTIADRESLAREIQRSRKIATIRIRVATRPTIPTKQFRIY